MMAIRSESSVDTRATRRHALQHRILRPSSRMTLHIAEQIDKNKLKLQAIRTQLKVIEVLGFDTRHKT
jgi:hypothetical protein